MVGVISGRFGLVATPIQTDADGRLIVRGEDQVFSYKEAYCERIPLADVAAGSFTLEGSVVTDGEVWVVTQIVAFVIGSVVTRITLQREHGEDLPWFKNLMAPPAWEGINWQGWAPLEYPNRISAYFEGCAQDDDLFLDIMGFKMTKET